MLSPSKNPFAPASIEQPGRARELVARHFLMQDDRPEHLTQVDIGALDPCLRTLLFTDGTVTRTLEVQMLSRVSIEVVDQTTCPAPEQAARYLSLDGHEEAVQRRVKMHIGDSEAPSIWAESFIIPARLPEGFLCLLGGTPEGIGESLQRLMLESARELLWLGLGRPPEWAEGAAGRPALTRLYRVTTHGQPALLISETFAVELASGAYRLAWPTDAALSSNGPDQRRSGTR